MYACMHVCMHACMYACMYVNICKYTDMCGGRPGERFVQRDSVDEFRPHSESIASSLGFSAAEIEFHCCIAAF